MVPAPTPASRTNRASSGSTSGARGGRERLELCVGQLQFGGGHVLLEVRDARGSRDREHDGGAAQQPRERELRRSSARLAGDGVEWPALAGELAGRDREPRDE